MGTSPIGRGPQTPALLQTQPTELRLTQHVAVAIGVRHWCQQQRQLDVLLHADFGIDRHQGTGEEVGVGLPTRAGDTKGNL